MPANVVGRIGTGNTASAAQDRAVQVSVTSFHCHPYDALRALVFNHSTYCISKDGARVVSERNNWERGGYEEEERERRLSASAEINHNVSQAIVNVGMKH